MKNFPEKLIALVGPTASGKSDCAIELARLYDGEILSADSRQVYRGMNIGTGKVIRDSHTPNSDTSIFLSEGIRHHGIDIADPQEDYNIAHFLRDAKETIANIRSRDHLPIICGGTHFWIQTLLEGNSLPEVPPNPALRLKLSEQTAEELFALLQTQDPARAENIDRHNTIRLIRALEIIEHLGKVPPSEVQNRGKVLQNIHIIALCPPKEVLRERIAQRLESRFAQGMIAEVEGLHTHGVSWERLETFGLEYRFIALFLQKKLTEQEMRVQLFHAIWHYAKRQLSWLRRWENMGAPIHWVEDQEKALKKISAMPHDRSE